MHLEDKIRPVMLWVCHHLVLRYEEVPLFIEAGAEVIPGFGDRDFLVFDDNYEDESNELYPNWRSYCTLPTHIVEQIRRIRIDAPTEEEAVFMNKWVDTIYIASFPKIASQVLTWYKGIVIFRVFGGFKSYTEICNGEGINLSIFEQNNDRFIWSPILKSLSSIEDSRLVHNEAHIPAFVSPKRLPFEWMERDSERIISTVIPYIHQSDMLYSIFQKFADAFNGIDFIVLGKNNKNSVLCQHPFILGNVNFNTLWSRLCKSRILCYGGYMTPYHLHFTPLEAIAIGVPILFLKQCGLAREAMEHGFEEGELHHRGMCEDFNEMKRRTDQLIDNFDQLNELRQLQQQLLVSVFSREKALDSARLLVNKISHHAVFRRNDYASIEAHLSSYKNPNFANNMITSPKLPAVAGEYRIWDARRGDGLTGTTQWLPGYHVYARLGRQGIDSSGLLLNIPIGHQAGRLTPGKYEFIVTIKVDEVSIEPDVYFQLGANLPDYTNFITLALHHPENSGILEVQSSSFIVPDLPTSALIFMQIYWLGRQSIGILKVLMRKLSDESEPVLILPSPITFRWGGSFSFLENGLFRYFRWCGNEGTLELENNSSVTKDIQVSFGVQTALPGRSTWSVSSKLWCESIQINGDEIIFKRMFSVLPGKHSFTINCSGKELDVGVGTRSLVFVINNFQYKDIPVSVEWGEGFSFPENGINEHWTWGAREAILEITNDTDHMITFHLLTKFCTNYYESSCLTIASSVWNETFEMIGETSEISRSIILPPGHSSIHFSSTARQVEAENLTRELVFCIFNFRSWVEEF
jgi:hypothetical protein